MTKQEKPQPIDLSQVSAKDLEVLLRQKKQEETQARLAARGEYETTRDTMVNALLKEAMELNKQMKTFKDKCLKSITDFKEVANNYGDIRSNSKGGFMLRTSDQAAVMSYDRNSKPEYDERASMAEQLLKDFLTDTIKKRDVPMYRTISALLERNRKGDYTPSRISALLKIRDNYADERWQKAMQLFEESYNNRDISYSVSFYVKNETGKDVLVPLSFASI